MGNIFSFTKEMENDSEQLSEEEDEFLPAKEIGDISTDAVDVLPYNRFPPKTVKINVSNIFEIEKELDLNEKVSMVYLLHNNDEMALTHLIQLQKGANVCVLYECLRNNLHTKSWDTKLMEALAIIQNYKILHNYGFTIEEINTRFLPLNTNTSIEIDITRKKLYRVCENFGAADLQVFLKHVRKDFTEKKIDFKSYDYLEMYLLHWSIIKYISPPHRFMNLAKVLKVMDMFEIYDYFQSISETNESSQNVRRLDATVPFALTRSSSNRSSLDAQEYKSDADSYEMNAEMPGECLIINQEEFYTEFDPDLKHKLPQIDHQLEQREGTHIDCQRIDGIMKSFGYNVTVENNLDHKGIMKALKDVVTRVTRNSSSLFVFILSHGIEGNVFGNNSIPIEVSTIKRIMCETNTRNLSGKPKVLIIQACQGPACQEVHMFEENDLQMDGPNPTPKTADMLVFWATVPGFGAIRDKNKGTWFIQSLCDKLEQLSEISHLEDICTKVINEITKKRWGSKAMVPIKESTLSAHLYLPKKEF